MKDGFGAGPGCCECYSERSEESLIIWSGLENSQKCFASHDMTASVVRGLLRNQLAHEGFLLF
jgi:hypothetical protein